MLAFNPVNHSVVKPAINCCYNLSWSFYCAEGVAPSMREYFVGLDSSWKQCGSKRWAGRQELEQANLGIRKFFLQSQFLLMMSKEHLQIAFLRYGLDTSGGMVAIWLQNKFWYLEWLILAINLLLLLLLYALLPRKGWIETPVSLFLELFAVRRGNVLSCCSRSKRIWFGLPEEKKEAAYNPEEWTKRMSKITTRDKEHQM